MASTFYGDNKKKIKRLLFYELNWYPNLHCGLVVALVHLQQIVMGSVELHFIFKYQIKCRQHAI